MIHYPCCATQAIFLAAHKIDAKADPRYDIKILEERRIFNANN